MTRAENIFASRVSLAKTFGIAAFIFLLGFAIYSPVWHGGFLWDDDGMITENGIVKSPHGLKMIWTGEKLPDYLPLTYSLFWWEWRQFGMNSTGYHLINIFLHALNCVLLWRVLLRLKIPGALFAAFIFLAHPVCVASVAWIAEGKNVLSMFFYLLTLLTFLRFETSQKKSSYALSLVFFLCALMSKSSVVVLPVVLLICAAWQRGSVTRKDFISALPFFLLAFIFSATTVWFQSHRAIGTQSDLLLVRLLGGSWAVWFYLAKALLPLNLMMIYPRWEIDPRSLLTYLPGMAWAAFIFLLWKFRARLGRAPLLVILYFFITLSPVLGIFDASFLIYSRASDHWQQLALISIAALFAGTTFHFFEKKFQNRAAVFKNAFAVVTIGVLSALTWNHAHAFSSSEALWRDNLKKNPKSWVAYNNLALLLPDKDEALRYFEEAVRLNPNYPEAHNNLGYILAGRKNLAEAIPHYLAALKNRPRYPDALNNLGNAFLEQGKLDDAIEQYYAALKIRSAYSLARNNLGYALMRKGKLDEAIAHLRIALEIDPNYGFAHDNLGTALVRQKKYEEAIEHFRAAIRLEPSQVDAHLNLASALSDLGRDDEAAAEFAAVTKLAPNRPDAWNSLGIASAMKGNLNEATRYFSEALRAQPTNNTALGNLGNVFAQQKKFDEAISDYSAALRIDGNDAGTHNNLANVLVELGRFDEAVQHYQAAIKLQPEDASFRFHCGLALLRQGQRDEAILYFREALRLNPSMAEAEKQLALLNVKK